MKPFLPLALLAAAAATPAAAQVVPVRDFARPAAFDNVKLSPNGDHVATSKRIDNQYALAVLRLSDFAVTSGFNFGEKESVINFHWVKPERVAAEIGQDFGYLVAPTPTGEIVGIDLDGKRKQYLFGQRGIAAKNTTITAYNTFMYAGAFIIDPMVRDPEWSLIAVQSFGNNAETREVYRLNVYNGVRSLVAKIPGEYVSEYLTDSSGRLRYATGAPTGLKPRTYALDPQTEKWSEVTVGELAKATLLPVNFSEQENAVYFLSNEGDGDRDCLVRQDLATGKRATVSCDERQTLDQTVSSADRSHPVAAIYAATRPELRVLAPESPEGKVLTALNTTFPDLAFGNFSYSLDGTKMLFFGYSDRDPGSYYLLDTAKGKLKRVLALRPWIKPEQMAERRPIAFKSRDGRPVYGYLTIPPGREARNLPVVVNPHGGPFGIRDHWGWDAEAQLLASRGYAVLQINFRGSGGYGHGHFQAGQANWGTGMINDITDGLRFAVQRGLVDAKRACIYGGSYGGYAALMSAVREPDAYKCVIDFAGIYDIPSYKSKTDIGASFAGTDFMALSMGDSKEIELEQSPSTHIAKLKAPVMIVHGEQDKRVPFNQAKQLRSALEARKHPYVWLAKANEEHGFYNEANLVEFYEGMLAFLEQHLGPGAPVMPEPKEKKK